jgi:tetratricopeptide (TPR) repeat protein
MPYHAFISYSHEEGARKARRLHQALLRFASPWYRRRSLRLFLDDANLPASPSLWESIRRALEDSEYFIFLASPSAAESPWCRKEIRFWLDQKGPDSIVLVLLSGTIAWDAATNNFDWSKTTALPHELAGVFSDEPFYVDVSGLSADDRYQGATARSRLADIAAVLLGKEKDDLIGEDLRQHRNALRLAGAAIAILLATSIVAGWQWYEAAVQRDLAETRLEQAVDITERMLFDIDDQLLGVAGAGELRRSLTYSALDLLIKLRQQAAGDDDVEWAQMTAYYQKGNLALRYGDLDEAEHDFREAQGLAEILVEKNTGYLEPYHSWALTHHALGQVYARRKDFDAAYKSYDRAQQLLDFMLEDYADDEDALLLQLNIFKDWGDAAYENRDMPVAHRNYESGIRLIMRLTDENPEDAEYWFLYSVMLDRKARYFPIHESPQELLDIREEAADILTRLATEFPEVAKYRLNLAVANEKLGDIAFEVDNLKGAKHYYSRSIENLRALFYAEPTNNLYRQMLATEYGNYGHILVELGEFDTAEEYFEQEVALSQVLTAIDPQNSDYAYGRVIAQKNLGDYYFRVDAPSSGIEQYRSALARAGELWEQEQSRRVTVLLAKLKTDLAEHLLTEEPDDVIDLIGEAEAHLEGWLESNERDSEAWLYLAQARTNSYLMYTENSRPEEAEIAAQRAKDALEQIDDNSRRKFAREIVDVLDRLSTE